MDYRPKMVVPNSKIFTQQDEEDEEDLDALRLAALKSLKTKTLPPMVTAPAARQIHLNFQSFGNHRLHSRDFYYPNRRPWMNGVRNHQFHPSKFNSPYKYTASTFQNVYYPSRSNQNLIEIVPVEENASTNDIKKNSTESDAAPTTPAQEQSKFHRYDNASGSDEEDKKENMDLNSEKIETEGVDVEIEIPRPASGETSPQPNPEASATEERAEPIEEEESYEEEIENKDDDDDDVLLMADHEEVDSLDRLMDEMDRELSAEIKPPEKKEKKTVRKESKESKRARESSKTRGSKQRDRVDNKNDTSISYKTTVRSDSPYLASRVVNRQKSLSPKPKSRKKSPRRLSPRRSPSRQQKKGSGRLRSPGKYSPKLSPRRSPTRRSPLWKLSPRGRSPLSRSPVRRRSRSRSPRIARLRSPRPPPSKSPRLSPGKVSPRVSPYRSSPRRPSPRPRSPKSPATRARSPHKSPWSSPRHSPRLSPRRKRSPGKESSRNVRGWSLTPEDTSLELGKLKSKSSMEKEGADASNNPVLEARRRKFESTRPIDPIIDNKKIKLSKKEDGKKIEITEDSSDDNSPKRKTREMSDEFDELEEDVELNLHDNYDLVEESRDEDESIVDIALTKLEKVEQRPKKKKKKDKEIYQVGKIKSELPLSERICKEKKCKKKHRDLTPDSYKDDEVESLMEEILDEETDLRTELSRRRAERLNRNAPIQSARLLQSALKGVNETVKNNAKAQKGMTKGDEKSNQKEVRRVTVLRRGVSDLHDSEDETLDPKVPVRFRLGLNKSSQDQSKTSRKSSKRQSRKVKHKNHLIVSEIDRKN